ncbi:unnamed protein product, partial [Polarella glacialis]
WLATPDVPTVLALVTVGVTLLVTARWLRRTPTPESDYTNRDFLDHSDLVDPKVRCDHLSFNAHLHNRFEGQRFVEVRGEEGCHVAFSYATCKEVMNDHSSFSSNPFPDNRLVALNTMTKADHSRVLRHIHSYYMQ